MSDHFAAELRAEALRLGLGYAGPTVADAPPAADASLPRIQIGDGRTAQAVEESLQVLREHADIFDLGGEIVRNHGERLVPLDRHALSYFMGKSVVFYRFTATDKIRLEDPPQRLIDQILSLGSMRGLKPLDAVTTIPTLRPDDSTLSAAGYDRAARLLYVGDSVTVPECPTADDARAAYQTVMSAFAEFPFVAPADWAAMLAALITAVVRPALPTAPAFAFDAPSQGSGKTLLASCVAALASGERPEPWPPVAARDDDEIRKRLFSALRIGARAILWDNLAGTLDSPSLAAFLTSPTFRDRILGRSESLALPNRAVFLMTGNNLQFAGDMPRRIITCRIDPRCEQPFARQFNLDPLAWIMGHRVQIATAALTIVKAFQMSGASPRPGSLASFEAWDRYVRQPVAWIMGADPMDAIVTGAEADPEREALRDLLTALRGCFGNGPFTAADTVEAIRRGRATFPIGTDAQRALAAAVADMAGRDVPSAKSIGRMFNFRRGRLVDGMKLECRQDRNVKAWFVG